MMAPALLTKKPSAKKVDSKQNMKKMDLNNGEVEKAQVTDEFALLKTKLSSENSFISTLLNNVPHVDDESDSDEGDANGSTSKYDIDGPANGIEKPDREELKRRLAAKLSEFQGKKLDFSDKKMKNKLKRKLDKLEKKKLKKKSSKMKLKIAKLAQATKAASSSPTASIKSEASEPVVQNRPPKPIFNSEGKMVYSKFDFGELTTPSVGPKKVNLDPKAALNKMKKVQEKVKTLEAKGETEKAKAIEEKLAWQGAIQRAEGLKVKDNAELLAKSIKKREKQKLHSKKKWSERVEHQKKQQDDRQKKRKSNLNKVKVEKKEKKLNRLAKKGKIIV